ncbi:MAG: hypothetical protein FJ100_11605 [Deltaproteobacteria bacterium]|nr:hypothetical protein [Deltaproteobacteria bacterium]
MNALVRLLAPDGAVWTLSPGDLIGRMATAALPIDDGRISEAHALVSLRAGELKLLGLRGVFAVDGKPCKELTLRPGLWVELAPGLGLEVLDVELPEQMLALQGAELPQQVLVGACSIMAAPRLCIVGRYQGDAAAHVWNNGVHWRLRIAGSAACDVAAGDRFVVAGHELCAVAVPVGGAGPARTEVNAAFAPPLRIVAGFDTVHIHQLGEAHRAPVTLDGISARIISELVALHGPAAWELLAGEIWRDETDRPRLRQRWDVSLARLRGKLRASGIRPDLVRAGGTGQVELLLYQGDVVDDRT